MENIIKQGIEAFRSAQLPVRILGYFGGILLATYGAYWAWSVGTTRRVKSNVSLEGKTVIITGANSALGKETAVDLATRGARVIMACRNPTRAHAALSEIRQRSGNDNIVFRQVEMSDLNSVRTFANQILREEKRLDILVHNAAMVQEKSGISPEGFDVVLATNHVGPFLLTLTLIDLLKKSAPSRIVMVSSLNHTFVKEVDYTNKSGKGLPEANLLRMLFPLYERSKLANIHFAKELARRLAGTGVTAYSLYPGAVYTGVWEKGFTGWPFLFKLALPLLKICTLDPKDGAQTTIYCAVDESITHLSGRYFTNCGLAKESKLAKDESIARQLWDVSCEATGVDPNKLAADN